MVGFRGGVVLAPKEHGRRSVRVRVFFQAQHANLYKVGRVIVFFRGRTSLRRSSVLERRPRIRVWLTDCSEQVGNSQALFV